MRAPRRRADAEAAARRHRDLSAFDRRSLSPRPTPPEPVDLPFGLTWSELAPALPSVALDRLGECASSKRYELQGLRDRTASTIVTVRYPTSDGTSTVDLFVKRTPVAQPEAGWYRHLDARGVPVPRRLADVPRPDGAVLVLELLATVGIDLASDDDVAELLRLTARLNATPHDGGVAPPPRGYPEDVFDRMVRDAVTAVRSLEGFEDVDIDPDRYDEVRRRCAAMPTALTHGELSFQQVGRTGAGALVVFDLATLGLRPRFSDLANVIGPLAEASGADERSVLERYLDELAQLGVDRPRIDDAHDELRAVRVCRAFESLPWLVTAHTDPEVGTGALRSTVAVLTGDVA